MAGRTSLTVYSGMTGMMESAFINIKNRSYSITADVEVPKKNANGVVICQGGRFGGWTLYLKNARPTFTYNWIGLNRYRFPESSQYPRGRPQFGSSSRPTAASWAPAELARSS